MSNVNIPKQEHQIILVKPPPMIEATLTDSPTLITCPYCQNRIFTKTYQQLGSFTFLAIGCFATCCLCCIPCIFPIFKDVRHVCPTCASEVGVYGRIGSN